MKKLAFPREFYAVRFPDPNASAGRYIASITQDARAKITHYQLVPGVSYAAKFDLETAREVMRAFRAVGVQAEVVSGLSADPVPD